MIEVSDCIDGLDREFWGNKVGNVIFSELEMSHDAKLEVLFISLRRKVHCGKNKVDSVWLKIYTLLLYPAWFILSDQLKSKMRR